MKKLFLFTVLILTVTLVNAQAIGSGASVNRDFGNPHRINNGNINVDPNNQRHTPRPIHRINNGNTNVPQEYQGPFYYPYGHGTEFFIYSGKVGSYPITVRLATPYTFDNRHAKIENGWLLGDYSYASNPNGVLYLVLRHYDPETGYLVMDEYDVDGNRTGHIEGTTNGFDIGKKIKGSHINSRGEKRKFQVLCNGATSGNFEIRNVPFTIPKMVNGT